MMRPLLALVLLGLLLSAVAATVTVSQWLATRNEAERQQSTLARTAEHARDIAALRTGRPAWAARPRSDAPLAPRVAAVVASCGLPASALANLSPEAETMTGDGPTKVTRQRATMLLANLTLPQVGKFLDTWRSAEPDWVITSIDLTPQSGAKETPGGDLPLRALIVIEAVFMPEPSPERATRSSFMPVHTTNTGGNQ